MKASHVIGGIIAIILFPVGCAVYSTWSSVTTAPARVINRTLQTDNIIGNYEWFKQQYEDVKAMDARLASQRAALTSFQSSAGPRTSWTFEDKTEHARLVAIVAGLEGQRASMVGDYNARAQMENRNLFRSRDLPERLN